MKKMQKLSVAEMSNIEGGWPKALGGAYESDDCPQIGSSANGCRTYACKIKNLWGLNWTGDWGTPWIECPEGTVY